MRLGRNVKTYGIASTAIVSFSIRCFRVPDSSLSANLLGAFENVTRETEPEPGMRDINIRRIGQGIGKTADQKMQEISIKFVLAATAFRIAAHMTVPSHAMIHQRYALHVHMFTVLQIWLTRARAVEYPLLK